MPTFGQILPRSLNPGVGFDLCKKARRAMQCSALAHARNVQPDQRVTHFTSHYIDDISKILLGKVTQAYATAACFVAHGDLSPLPFPSDVIDVLNIYVEQHGKH